MDTCALHQYIKLVNYVLMKGTSLPCSSVWLEKATWGDRGAFSFEYITELSMQTRLQNPRPKRTVSVPRHPVPNLSVMKPFPSKIVVNAAKLLIAAWASLNLAVTFQIGLILDVKPQEYKCSLTTEHSRH